MEAPRHAEAFTGIVEPVHLPPATDGIYTARRTAPVPERLFLASELRQRLQSSNGVPTVVVFGARTCRACRALQPKMERVAQAAAVRFLYVYHDKLTHDVFDEYQVTETPTTVVFDAAGALVSQEVYAAGDMPRLASQLATLQKGTIEWGI